VCGNRRENNYRRMGGFSRKRLCVLGKKKLGKDERRDGWVPGSLAKKKMGRKVFPIFFGDLKTNFNLILFLMYFLIVIMGPRPHVFF